jgi:hypothetical protein
MLPALLDSLFGQDYPKDLYAIHVVADNCDDRTAEVARGFGVDVFERRDAAHPGKGQALAALITHLKADTRLSFDAYVFVDADSVVAPDFLRVIDWRLAQGPVAALQASYRVAQPEASPITTLRAMGFALMHELRGRGKLALGISCGIWGNGFVVQRAVLDRNGWQSFSSVEDAEQHILFLLKGYKVQFVPDARVYGDMPRTLSSSIGQQQRWEGGRLALLRRWWRQLLGATLRRRNASAGVALAELTLPPLSVVIALLCAMSLAGWLLGPPAARLAIAMSAAGLALYVGIGLKLSGLSPQSYFALRYAPGYIAWKILLYVRELVRGKDPAWHRTVREHEAPL